MAEKIPQNKVNYSTYLTDRKLNSFFLEATTENEVKNEISHLKENKSCGHDEIPAKVVKQISTYS